MREEYNEGGFGMFERQQVFETRSFRRPSAVLEFNTITVTHFSFEPCVCQTAAGDHAAFKCLHNYEVHVVLATQELLFL